MDDWDDVLLAAHNARISMGSWSEPAQDQLMDLTLNQWQREMARRMVTAACRAMAQDSELRRKYGFDK